jgi:hypothetical protein
LLKSSKSGAFTSAASAFAAAVQQAGTLFDDLEPNGASKKIKLHVDYPNNDDHFVIETALGPVRIESIIFFGELNIRERQVPITATAEYRHAVTGEAISRFATFEPQSIHGMKISLEMHHLAETGETHIVMRHLTSEV